MTHVLILAFDVGTSGVKTTVVSSDGRIMGSQTASHETHVPRDGWAEQAPSDWWDGICRTSRELMAQHPDWPKAIASIGLSGQMLGCLPLDADGNVLHNSMIHSDCRAVAECQAIAERVSADDLYRITGNKLDARSPLCKLLWLKSNEPALYKQTERFVQSKDYIVGKLVGRFDSTDFSDASHAQWLDIAKLAYAEDAIAEIGLNVDKLPALHAGTDVVGELTAERAAALGLPAGIPVVAGAGDGPCATVGAGAVSPGDTYCCIGTTAWIASTVGQPIIDPQARIFDIVSADGQSYGVFGTIQCAGRSVDWAMDLLQEPDFERFDDLIGSVPAGSESLLFLPYLEGERSPIWDTDARGVFFGITPSHGREHFLRATVEGVSFALRSVLDVMREHASPTQLRLIGGGGQSAAWQQILADVCDIEVAILSTQAADATSLGAALTAGVGVGLFPSLSEAIESITIHRALKPDGASAEAYEKLFRVYGGLYPSLKSAFAALRDCPPPS